ncbi:unnamed protein product [Protopolystoma xenopodis]|uniref:Uncharacterized protein n=1 Tax=Protopolystoma xenopodis TaxID=117903 RepID=A0A3S5B463_9PLAT|nr:unnamed protein product [Protopolystoma xenopodis]
MGHGDRVKGNDASSPPHSLETDCRLNSISKSTKVEGFTAVCLGLIGLEWAERRGSDLNSFVVYLFWNTGSQTQIRVASARLARLLSTCMCSRLWGVGEHAVTTRKSDCSGPLQPGLAPNTRTRCIRNTHREHTGPFTSICRQDQMCTLPHTQAHACRRLGTPMRQTTEACRQGVHKYL